MEIVNVHVHECGLACLHVLLNNWKGVCMCTPSK